MSQPLRRYLTNFDSTRTGHVLTDVLVIGSGAAGLIAAIEAARHADVILATKGSRDESATFWAQGGVAAVMSRTDSIEEHIRDTLSVGAGLNRREAVDLVCRQAPERMQQLIDWGLPFDQSEGRLALGLEAGHTHPRILHAGGDATGRQLAISLLHKMLEQASVRYFENCFLIDLLTVDGRCVGAVTYHPRHGHQLIWAKRIILATGGFGAVYRESTNPPAITGDGVAAAFRAGAAVTDMEMFQFHPTTLYVAGSARALISEAARGEGAWLVNRSGERFMQAYHPDGELAPRDVVSRAIVDQLRKTDATSVFLDARHLGRNGFAERFPTITERCREFGIDPAKDLIPVRPAAHFSIGGVITDLEARTSVAGLFCCGEAACTGLHGANRLASNSLLEGLVFGRMAGSLAGAEAAGNGETVKPLRLRNVTPPSPKTMLDLSDVRQSLRSLMWRNVGIVRHGDRLAETVEIIDFWNKFVLDKTFDEPSGWEIQNMLLLGRLMAQAALERAESRGVHYRSDCGESPRDDFILHFTYRLQAGAPTRGTVGLDFQPMAGRR